MSQKKILKKTLQQQILASLKSEAATLKGKAVLQVKGFVAAFGIAGVFCLPVLANAMPPLPAQPPVLAEPCLSESFVAPTAFFKNIGVWEGSTYSYNAEGAPEMAFHQKLEINLNGSRYFQRNTYYFADGKVAQYAFPGFLSCDGVLHVVTDRIDLWSKAVSESILVNVASNKGLGGEDVAETIHVISENARIRTNQRSKDGKMLGVFFMNESRTSPVGPAF